MPLICFISPKGGVGKTTLTANVAANLASEGRRVVALDLDPQGSLGLHFGQNLHSVDGFGGGTEPGDPGAWRRSLVTTHQGVLLLPRGRSGLDRALTLSAAWAARPELLAGPLSEILTDPATFVVADLPPGPSIELAIIAPYGDLFVTVLLSDAASAAQVPAIESGIAYGRGIAPDRVRFVLNQVDNRLRLGRAVSQAAVRHLGPRLLGLIYRDEAVAEAFAAQRPVRDYAPRSKAAQDFASVTAAILGHLSAIHARSPATAWPEQRLRA
jgi:cellulose synthase operon protein YhjQ